MKVAARPIKAIDKMQESKYDDISGIIREALVAERFPYIHEDNAVAIANPEAHATSLLRNGFDLHARRARLIAGVLEAIEEGLFVEQHGQVGSQTRQGQRPTKAAIARPAHRCRRLPILPPPVPPARHSAAPPPGQVCGNLRGPELLPINGRGGCQRCRKGE